MKTAPVDHWGVSVREYRRLQRVLDATHLACDLRGWSLDRFGIARQRAKMRDSRLKVPRS